MTNLEYTFRGIPCQIEVLYYKKVPAWRGSPNTCPSDVDYYGYTEIDFNLLDRKGYRAKWLENKLEAQDILDIKEFINEKLSPSH
jgi:hypothetical protein